MRAILLVVFLGISYLYGQLFFHHSYLARLACCALQEASGTVKSLVPSKAVLPCTRADAVASAPAPETTQMPHVWMWQ